MISTMIEIVTLLHQQRQRVGNSLFLSIDGHGGSGKSTLARQLASYLDAGIIQTDDFASLENARNWWPKLVQSVFQPIERGATTLNYERSKWWPNHNPQPILNQMVTEVMILEGVGASQAKLRKYLGLSIFVHTPRAICLQRGIARDQKANAASEEDIRKHWEQWIQEEVLYFKNDKPDQFAELIVDGRVPFGEQIKELN